MANLPHAWRCRDVRYRLEGNRCETCQTVFFPPKRLCVECRSRQLKSQVLDGEGEIYSFSHVMRPFDGENTAPYLVALVQLKEGPKVSAQLVDVEPDEVFIGMRVEMVTRILRQNGSSGLIEYGYKFRPIWFETPATS